MSSASSRSLDDRRVIIFRGAAAMSVLTAVVQGAAGSNIAWELSCAVTCAITARLMRSPSERLRTTALAGMAVFLMLGAPVVAVMSHQPTDLLVLLVLPLALTVIFIDRVPVVISVCLTGLVVNSISLVLLAWESADILHAIAAMFALYGAGVMGALEFSRMRRVEREQRLSLQRATEVQLQSERLLVLGSLAAGVAHEVNNPLAFVLANVKHLQETESPNETREEIWSETIDGLARISALVNDLKGMARTGSSEVRPLRVEPVLRQAARIATLRGSRAQVRVQVDPELPPCVANEQRLVQVILNLVVNACQALEETPRAEPRIELTARRGGDRVLIDIDDNGPGVTPPARAHLFTPFFTTRTGVGTGLGLALSREYVEAFGGHLLYEPSSLGGARFRIDLPAAAVAKA